MIQVRLYTYQLCRGIGYIHSTGICHRDIKPHNILVDIDKHVVKFCDFGSAKRLVPNEVSVAYICSRYYRAPELMLGSTNYSTDIDTWSVGCVFGELLTGRPLFVGETSVDQLVKIMQVLGTPSREAMHAMNPRHSEVTMPQLPRVMPMPLAEHLEALMQETCKRSRTHEVDAQAVDLLSRMLRYEPNERIKPLECLAHPFFDPLRERGFRLPGDAHPPPLFNFSNLEKQHMRPEILAKVVPVWARK